MKSCWRFSTGRNKNTSRAPAIVISSLGGLVYGKDSLAAKDAYRARLLRHALKAQLGRPRGPHPRGQAYVDNDFASDILQHRVLPDGNTKSVCSPVEESSIGLCTLSSSNLKVRINTRAPSSSEVSAQACRKRGWKIQGQLAGEWRDHLGRHRRTRPTTIGTTINAVASPAPMTAADTSMLSSVRGSSSCAGTEVSFEGLVDELRECLPHPLLLAEYVATQQQRDYPTCSGVEAMMATATATTDEQQEEASRKRRANSGGGNYGRRIAGGGGGGGGEGKEDPEASLGMAAAARNCTSGISVELQRGRAASPGLMPPGCLRLRHAMIGSMRVTANPQPLVRSGQAGSSSFNHPQLNSTVGVGRQPSLVFPPGGLLYSDGSAYRLVRADVCTGATESSASPSAAMVAAAKAHERALPLLQVCAIKVVEPAGC